MTRRRLRGAVLASTLLLTTLAIPGAGGSTAKTYLLLPKSTFSEGCFPPCLCPVFITDDLRGIFTLTPLPSDPVSLFRDYAVTNVRWRATIFGKDASITGSGTYRVGGEFAVEQQLALDLAIGGDPPRHFDSGLVPGGGEFPKIATTISLHSQTCFDTVIDVRAAPAPGGCQ